MLISSGFSIFIAKENIQYEKSLAEMKEKGMFK